MNSALAALFGAVGGGARSYGQNTIREEQQAALEQQRMNELKQQEQARLNVAREAAIAAREERERENSDLTSALVNMKILQPGQTATSKTAPFYQSEMANRRNTEAIAGARERTDATTGAAMERLERQISAGQGLSSAREAAAYAQAAAANARAAAAGGAGQPPGGNRKPMPVSVAKDMGEIADLSALIRDAKSGMATPEAKDAVGWKYNLANIVTPKALEGRAQSFLDGGKGDVVRARLGNVRSTIGKLRSGGTITDGEFALLETFLPSAGDDYEKATNKLNELDRVYNNILQRKTDTYGETYNVPNALRPGGGAPAAQPQAQGRAATDAEAMSALQAAGGDAKKAAAMLRAKGLR